MRRPPISNRPYTPFPFTTRFRSRHKNNPDPDPQPAPACPAVVIRTAIRRGSSRRAPPPSLPSRPTAHHQLSSTHPEPAFGGAPFDPPTSHMPAHSGQLISRTYERCVVTGCVGKL